MIIIAKIVLTLQCPFMTLPGNIYDDKPITSHSLSYNLNEPGQPYTDIRIPIVVWSMGGSTGWIVLC